MQANRGWLASVVYARVRDQHAVDEILQETAMAASRNQPLINDSDGVCRWLYRVALRQALLYRRRMIRHVDKLEKSHVESKEDVKEETQCPFQILVATEKAELVQAALLELAAKDCEVLLLKYQDGWSCREMASRLKVSESAMKSRLLRARQNLRAGLLKLGDYWEEL